MVGCGVVWLQDLTDFVKARARERAVAIPPTHRTAVDEEEEEEDGAVAAGRSRKDG